MKLQDSKERICNLLKDTIITFCKNFVSFNFVLNLEGVIVITSDNENVLIIKFDETHNVQTKDGCNQQSNTMPSRSATSSKLLSINKNNSNLNANRQLALQYPRSANNSYSSSQPKVRQRISLSSKGSMPVHQPMNMAFRPRMTVPRVRGQRAGRGMGMSSRGGSVRGATNARPRMPCFPESKAMVPFNHGFRNALAPVADHRPRMPGSFMRQMVPAPQRRVQAAICSPDSSSINNNPVPLLAICDVGSNVTVETTNVTVFDETRDKIFADIVSTALSKLDEKKNDHQPVSTNLTKNLSPKINHVEMHEVSSRTDISKVENILYRTVHSSAAVQQPRNLSVDFSHTPVISSASINVTPAFNSMFSNSSGMNVNSTITNNQIFPPSYSSVCQAYRSTVTKPTKTPSRLQIALVPAKKPGQLQQSNSNELQLDTSRNVISSSGSQSYPDVSAKTVRVASLITLPKTSPVSSMQLVPLSSFTQQNQGIFRSPTCSYYQPVPTNNNHPQNIYRHAQQPCKAANQIQSNVLQHQFSGRTSRSQQICQPRNSVSFPRQNLPRLHHEYVSPTKNVSESHTNYFNYMPQNTLKPGDNQQMLLNLSNFIFNQSSHSNSINSLTTLNQRPALDPHISAQRASGYGAPNRLISGPLTCALTGVNVCNTQTVSPYCKVLSPQKLLNHYPQFVSGYNSFQPFNSCDNNVQFSHQNVHPGYRNVGHSHQNIQHCRQNVQSSHQNVQSSHQNVQPCYQNVQSSLHNVQPNHQKVQPSHQKVQPSHQNVQPSHQNVLPDCQNLQPVNQNLQQPRQNNQPILQAIQPNQQIVLPGHQSVANIPQQCNITPDFQNISNVSSLENISKNVNNYKSLDVSLDSQISTIKNLQNLSESFIADANKSSSCLLKAPGNLGTDQEEPARGVLQEPKLPPLRLKNLGDGSMVVMDPSLVEINEGHLTYNNTKDSNVLQDLHEYAFSQVMKAVEGLKKDTHLSVKNAALESNDANNVQEKHVDTPNLLSDVSCVVSQSFNVEPFEHYSILDVSQNVEIASHGTISKSVSTASLLETAEKSLLDSFTLGLAEDMREDTNSDITEGPDDDILNQTVSFDLSQDQHTCQACFINMDSIVMLAEHYSHFHTIPSVHWREKDVGPHIRKMENYNTKDHAVLLCPFEGCRKSFSLLKGLVTHHMRSHRCRMTPKQIMALKKETGTLLKCNFCESRFITKKTLSYHISRVHGSIHFHV